jgi:exopolyphosphatase/pppGpp-phosphohydrolase
MTTEKPRPMSSQEIFDTYEAELARLRQERDELVGISKALVSAHEWAIANPDSPVSATINYGHVATDAKAFLTSLSNLPK